MTCYYEDGDLFQYILLNDLCYISEIASYSCSYAYVENVSNIL